jgi:hypothetical protein
MDRSARIAVVCVFLLFWTAAVAAQDGPRRTECRQWDDAFLALFTSFLMSGGIASLAFGLLSGFLGRRYWWATSPAKRIVAMTAVVFSVLAFLLHGWPRFFGFGSFLFSGVSPDYLLCQDRAFSATGLLNGLIGANVPALAQWPAMTAMLAAGCAMGGLVAFALGRIIVAMRGLASVAKAGAV